MAGKRKQKQHRWEVNNGLEWSLLLSEALSSYVSDLMGNPEYLEESRKFLEKFGMSADEIDALSQESFDRWEKTRWQKTG